MQDFLDSKTIFRKDNIHRPVRYGIIVNEIVYFVDW